MVRSIVTRCPETDFVLLAQRRSPLASVATWAAVAHGATEIEQLATKLTARLADAAGRSIVLVIEGIGELLNTEADMALQDLLRVCRDQGVFVIAEGETSSLTGSWPLLQAVKSYRCGIVLQPDQMDGDMLFKTPFPRTTRHGVPCGAGSDGARWSCDQGPGGAAGMIVIDGYADIERIGQGGLGDVYRATRISTGGTVAIKVLRDVSDESVAWHRTRRELTALVSLAGHANVIQLFEMLDLPRGRRW